ncbi:CKLF-like MARVEL transmembrane domain-containing protein 1 isoform X2 [Bos indicus]|uniref:CKLF-like MARVEL transmembrane domain-containing protein 1 isoform X2 n=1 Tax=Bos indicus TaxID=9915 RepID=A0ABM4QU47_BOSIN|nr:PREDICTED: uncharacterized protein LOC106700523 [Bos mutus]XP_024834738.1 uncharacterized protein LOC112442293 isoform X5 [Bos taurus]DAA20276.1 TPA: chemokine-like factor superfamily 1-like [Bos taurus]
MDAEKENPPSRASKSGRPPARSVRIAEGPHPERSSGSTLSEHGVSAAPSAYILKQPSTPATLSQEEKEAIQKRAEGRAKVPPKFRDSIKRFFFSPTGALKIIRLDLINSFITAVFLLIVAILAIQEKERRHLFYIGGALCLTAATVCVIDATLVTKTMRNNLKKALGIKMITSGPLAPEPTPPTRTPTRGGPNAPTRATVKQRSQWQPSSKATSQRNPGGRL